GEHEQAGGDQQLVRDRVEHAAERGLLAPDAGEIAVEEIGDAGRNEKREGNPVQPKAAAEKIRPGYATDYRRHRGHARIGQKVRDGNPPCTGGWMRRDRHGWTEHRGRLGVNMRLRNAWGMQPADHRGPRGPQCASKAGVPDGNRRFLVQTAPLPVTGRLLPQWRKS